MKHSVRVTAGFLIMFMMLILMIYLNINTGSVHLSLKRIAELIVKGNDGSTQGDILWNIRMSRMLGAALMGGTLSISGFLLQTFFKNPIAGPFVLGISSGSRLFVGFYMLAAVPFISIKALSPYTIFIAAFIGAMFSMGLVLLVSERVHNIGMLLVIGMMIGYICSAGTDFMITFAESTKIAGFTMWSMGSFSGITWTTLKAAAIIIFPAVIMVFFLSKPLFAYLLGEEYAKSMGVNIKSIRRWIVILSSLLSACVTAFAGPISFVGIAVPHITKMIFASSKPSILIPAIFINGAVFCLMCDLIARTIFAPTELAISTVTSVIGAPIVIWLLIKRRRS